MGNCLQPGWADSQQLLAGTPVWLAASAKQSLNALCMGLTGFMIQAQASVALRPEC